MAPLGVYWAPDIRCADSRMTVTMVDREPAPRSAGKLFQERAVAPHLDEVAAHVFAKHRLGAQPRMAQAFGGDEVDDRGHAVGANAQERVVLLGDLGR